MSRAGCLGLAAICAAGACGGDGGGSEDLDAGETGPMVEYVAARATFLAVRADGGPWQRVEGDRAVFAATHDYEVAVVCRSDIGLGWSEQALVGEVLPVRTCREAPGVNVVIDVTSTWLGGVVFIGERATFGPDGVAFDVTLGRHDVIAMRMAAATTDVELVQVWRDVEIEGPRTFEVDLDAGTPPVEVALTVDGLPGNDLRLGASVQGLSAGGTAFQIFGRRPRVLPDAMRVPGDVQTVRVHGLGDGWLEVPVDERAQALTTPAEVLDASFRWPAAPVVSWPVAAGWEGAAATFGMEGRADFLRRWTMYASAGAMAAHAGTLEVAIPDVEGWDAGWWPDPGAALLWQVALARPRAGGGVEGLEADGTASGLDN
jgi:hypothetical protein